jgi:hypothetical protein
MQRKGHRICKRLRSGVFSVARDGKSMTEIWSGKQWVDDYSSRELSIPEDRLPAIAGIPSEFEKLWDEI